MRGERCIHVGIDNPLQVFLAFLGTARTAMHASEEPWIPLHAILCPHCSFFALHVFDFCLLVCGQLVVAFLDGAGRPLPQPLGFSLFLFFDGSDQRGGRLRPQRIEECFLLAGLEKRGRVRLEQKKSNKT